MSHHVRAGARIFSDWRCCCGHEYSTNRHADVGEVRCPQCGHANDMEPIKAEFERARRDALRDEEARRTEEDARSTTDETNGL